MSLPYQEPGRSIEERVSDLLARMTLEEKAAQMHALWLILSEDGEHRPREDDFTGGTDPAAVRKALGHGLGRSRGLSAATASPRARGSAPSTACRSSCARRRASASPRFRTRSAWWA